MTFDYFNRRFRKHVFRLAKSKLDKFSSNKIGPLYLCPECSVPAAIKVYKDDFSIPVAVACELLCLNCDIRLGRHMWKSDIKYFNEAFENDSGIKRAVIIKNVIKFVVKSKAR